MGEDPQLTVDCCADPASGVSTLGDKLRQVLAEMIEHRAYEILLTSEMPIDQAVVDTRARRDVTDQDVPAGRVWQTDPRQLQNRSNDFIPAQRCTGSREPVLARTVVT